MAIHTAIARQRYQRAILGSLVVLWVAILPWLCWGGWSNPHHPHASPHFVFAAPSLLDQDHHSHPEHTANDPLAGVARPDTLLIALLALIFPALRALLTPRQPHFTYPTTSLWSHAASILVPTPPPRAFLPVHKQL